jgi:hypothetical protein
MSHESTTDPQAPAGARAEESSEETTTGDDPDMETGSSAAAPPNEASGDRREIILETRPTLKPALARLTAVLVVGIALIGYLFANPTLLGTAERTEIAANLLVLLTVVGAGRLAFELYLLTRTRYVITRKSVRREYSLLYKTFSRELPLSKLRSHELHRSRIETALGVGTVGFLTGSIARSPAHLEFENVPHPEQVRRQVRHQLLDDDR